MEQVYIETASIISCTIFIAIALFQIGLAVGFPLAEFSWGGKYKGVLPKRQRIASLVSTFILVIMGIIIAMHGEIMSFEFFLIPSGLLAWCVTAYLGLNTLGNLASKSKKEKLLMTPLSGIAFLACLIVSIYG